jgi:hypothetical protein
VFDAASEPTSAVQPDPHRAVPIRPVPERIGQVLGLLRTLLAYGRGVAVTLRQHAADAPVLPCFTFLAITFGTSDPARILARIMRGLLRAAALEARLSRRAARGRDLKPTPIRLPRPRKPRATKPPLPPSEPAQDPSPARQPTPEEIIAKDRRRPIGRVLVEICHDLGIVPAQMDRATWDALRRDIMLYGGSLARLVLPKYRRRSANTAGKPGATFPPIPITGPIAFPPWPAPSPQSPAPTGAGPP